MGFFDSYYERARNVSIGGNYMSGGPISDVLDVFSTAQYAAAGGTEALLSGDSPMEGALEGIQRRASFVDVLSERDVPTWAAMPLGLAADVLTPTIPGLGLISKGARGAQRGAEIVSRLRGGRTIEEVVGGAANAMRRLTDEAVTSVGVARARAARETFAANAGSPAAPYLARRAAAGVGTQDDAVELGRDALRRASEEGIMHESASGIQRVLRGLQVVRDNVFNQWGTVLSKHSPEMGEAGPRLVEQGRDQLLIEQQLKAHMHGTVDDILKPLRLNKRSGPAFMHYLYTGQVKGMRAPLQWEDARKKLRGFYDEVFESQSSRGIRQKNDIATVLFARMRQDRQARVIKALEDPADALDDLTESELNWVTEVRRFNGSVDGSGAVVQPLAKLQDYIPTQLNRKALRERGVKAIQDIDEMVPVLMSKAPDMSENEARGIARRLVAERISDPTDIFATFQHQRQWGGPDFADMGHMEMNPHKVLHTHADKAAESIARAQVWGGDNSVATLMRNKLALQHGIAPQVGDEAAVKTANPVARRALDKFDSTWRILAGKHGSEVTPALRLLNSITNFMYLGPRTVLLQPLNLPNSGAMSGIGNSFAGMWEFMANPEVRSLVQRAGATLPDMSHALNEGVGIQRINEWNPIMSAIGRSDRFVRGSAGFAGALHMADLEAKLARTSDPRQLENIAREFMQYGVDADALRAAGGRLTREQLNQGMVRAANATNFTGDQFALPASMSTPVGKFFMKFRQFSLQQGHFITRLMGEARRGNWGPLLRYAAMFPWVYSHVFKLVNALRQEPIDPDAGRSYEGQEFLQNMLFVGALGYMGDMAAALNANNDAVGLGSVAGANTGTLLRTGRSAFDVVVRQDFETARRTMTPNWWRQSEALLGAGQ